MYDLIFLILGALTLKHFVIDFPLQTPYQWQNKGKYGHLGGILHASLHGAGTILVLMPFVGLSALYFGVIDAIVHYHIDWAKINLNSRNGWAPMNSPHFWTLLGFDQLLHSLTYLLITYSIFSKF